MKIHTEYLWFNSSQEQEFINITDELKRILKECKIKDGMMLVSAMHITAGVYINDDEPGLIHDIQEWLTRLAPVNPDYQHHRTGEENGHAHLRSMLVHHEVIVPITEAKLDLGRWQEVFYAEFDGKRKKRVIVKVMGV